MARIGENSSNPMEIQRKGTLFFEFCKLNLRSNSGYNIPFYYCRCLIYYQSFFKKKAQQRPIVFLLKFE